MKKRNIHTILYSFAFALVFTILVRLGALNWPDQWLQDYLYQKPQYMNGEVLLFGIDEKSLQELGPYNTWDRHIMARALEALASDPEHRPAVVAIDTLYSMETDPEADAHLAKAAEELGCVVTATAASYVPGWYEAPDGTLQWDDYRIVQYEEPYDALKAVTTQGHINAMNDEDGIMRHGLLYIEPEQRVYSMAYQVVRMYREKRGEEFTPPQTNRRGQFYVAYTGRPRDYYR